LERNETEPQLSPKKYSVLEGGEKKGNLGKKREERVGVFSQTYGSVKQARGGGRKGTEGNRYCTKEEPKKKGGDRWEIRTRGKECLQGKV